ncbi:hypothetical protein AAX05_04800 [Moraxella bovoculi]|uniref:Entericidin EcnAB n=1 Tax=Moraxella bovoculi TaxID=386891 RepID=A0AAC8T9W1_9GAMM|nr:hypothetical protein [Moraxella bovoculi]AKG07866.1 hypothetical protein AAX06_06505 [Moraxella bovoculi]AKG09596.1 hypothetical protein AAX05_04800 [Moraxella bovoculi]AKG11413.1 hypothetical protein AAX07_04775 [Moraxella bovoculi]AKG13420.1 hypothetical protein AAX11_04545 [Moraxella bovoculi]
MKKLLVVTAVIGAFALAACSQNTKDKAAETADAAKTDIAANTAAVAKEAEAAAQNVAEAAKSGVQTAADKTSEAAKEVGAIADAVTNADGAEAKVPEDQKY